MVFIQVLTADLAQIMCAYNLRYLEKIPQEYFCVYKDNPGEVVSCVPQDFCSNQDALLSYEPNMELEDSYYNWV